MGTVYSTIQGDTWDLIALSVYGDAFAMTGLLEANPHYADIVIFPSGYSISVPTLSEDNSQKSDAPPWRDDD